MKKVLALALALVIALSMSAMAFAAVKTCPTCKTNYDDTAAACVGHECFASGCFQMGNGRSTAGYPDSAGTDAAVRRHRRAAAVRRNPRSTDGR